MSESLQGGVASPSLASDRVGLVPRSLSPGELLGNIRLVEIVGQGAMGVVWKGHHVFLDMPVAIKVMRPMGMDNPLRHRQCLRREAQLTARLNHPGIVRVLDFFEEGDIPCIVMEYVEGTTLSAYQDARGRFSERKALLMGFHLCSALAVAHTAGILHRDLKPSNILIAGDGTLKLGDFGLAQPVSNISPALPRHILGTPRYMAPEFFVDSSSPDLRCDLYSLGVILYQLMAGNTPFIGSTTQVMNGHLHLPPDLSRVPEGSRQILSKLLEKDPARRYDDAFQVREVLRCRGLELDADRSSRTRTQLEWMESRLPDSFATDDRMLVMTRGQARNPWTMALFLAILVCLLGWVLYGGLLSYHWHP